MEEKTVNGIDKTITKPEVPLVMRINDAKKETTIAINDILKRNNLPCFLYEPILYEAYRQVLEGSKRESGQAYAEYERLTQEWENSPHTKKVE